MGTDQLMARAAELLWTGGLAAVPLAVVVAVVCRARSLRPATRHMLWFAVLASFVTPAIGALVWTPQWFRSDRLIGAVEPGVVEELPAVSRAVSDNELLWRVEEPVRAMPLLVYANTAAFEPRGAGEWVRPSVESAAELVGPVPVLADPLPFDRMERRYAGAPAPVVEAGAKAAEAAAAVPVREWLGRVLAVRDAVADVPPIPASLWFGGAVLVVILSVWRRCMGAVWLREATPAGPHVQATVRQVGEALGLTRVPRAVFIEAAVSPMIWCGLRPVLVLPSALWRTLDEDSRRAVLVHELAHVRRFDHVICWVEAVVGALYWWHPVVWWVRRRMHEEAEASCDTWVTALFPGNRRAYASALVVTKSFVSARATSRGPWLGVVSGSAKRLARRITMVMTHKAAPRMSMLGVFVTTVLLGTGAFVMPGLACPPEDEANAKKAKARVYYAPKAAAGQPANVYVAPSPAPRAGGQRVFVTPTPPAPPAPPAPPGAAQGGVHFFGEAPALEAMRARTPTPPAAPSAPRAPKAPKPAKAVKPGVAVAAPMPAPQVSSLEALKEGREPREYRLSQGKLQAFYGMMSRNDVPILVQMGDDHITIWGTDEEHAVFSQFVRIVEGGKARSSAGVNRFRVQSGLEAAQGQQEAAAAARRAYEAATLGRAAGARERQFLERSLQDTARAQAEAERAGAQATREQQRALEQHMRTLERQVREMEQRAQRLERERARPGMMTPDEDECEKECEEDDSTN
jgi:beta-lactamase regulating signal transducer with metallopeptidase domain